MEMMLATGIPRLRDNVTVLKEFGAQDTSRSSLQLRKVGMYDRDVFRVAVHVACFVSLGTRVAVGEASRTVVVFIATAIVQVANADETFVFVCFVWCFIVIRGTVRVSQFVLEFVTHCVPLLREDL
jgi:hypothetical protein